ncbi:hypothetical protein NDU88_001512 [Pleurodeles waltl]|uniref:Uncharacterized protein n=1 Tax=Pleurodeles waltl TaxID=8319 RepID=A0AAV7VWP0_PLEWA|nr:hypothetical protein NDU88_001512 [Pleurodeles waltl]
MVPPHPLRSGWGLQVPTVDSAADHNGLLARGRHHGDRRLPRALPAQRPAPVVIALPALPSAPEELLDPNAGSTGAPDGRITEDF